MGKLDWEELKRRYSENPISHTKSGIEFRVVRVTENAVYVDLPSKDEYVSRENLEKAVELLTQGDTIKGPTDYKHKVYDQRPSYAWAILRDMGFVAGE